jgi:hypothetical protein
MPGFVDVSNMSAQEVRRLGHADDDYEAPRSYARYTPPPPQTYAAELIWALAVAADRINNGYFKEDVYVMENECRKRVTQANKLMVKEWLRTGYFSEATAEDYAAGRELRTFFNTYTLKALTGQISDFDKQALKIAQMEQFTGRHLLEFSIMSCLPSAARRERDRTEIKREVYNSEQLKGDIGDTIVGDIDVINSRYSKEYNRYHITARMGESFVNFWLATDLQGEHRIRAKIKQQRGDKTTALNYVKVTG